MIACTLPRWRQLVQHKALPVRASRPLVPTFTWAARTRMPHGVKAHIPGSISVACGTYVYVRAQIKGFLFGWGELDEKYKKVDDEVRKEAKQGLSRPQCMCRQLGW